MTPASLAARVARLKQAPADDTLLANEAVGLAAELLQASQQSGC